MAGKFTQVVSTVFTAKDRITEKFNKMGRSADKFGDKAEKAFKRSSRSAKKFQSVTAGILKAQVIGKGFQALSAGVSSAAVEFANFDQSILSASAKFKGLDLSTKEGLKTFESLKKSARELGATTEFTSAQAAQGLDFLALAGFNAEQAMAALPGTINLATSANIDLGRATDIATDSLGAFGLMTKDSVKLQKNLTRVNDVMAKTMATSNTNIEQMFEAVASGAADFTQAGQSMETFSALVGTMANAGKKGESAGTALRNIMVRLAAPTGQAAKILDRLNIKTQDQAGNFRDVVDILGDFDKATRKMGSAQKTAVISTVFGLRAQGAINILLKAGAKNMKAYREELVGAGGASQKMADIMRTSLINKLKTLRSALIELSFKVFENFEVRGKKGIDAITEAVRRFDPKPMITSIERIIVVIEKIILVFERLFYIINETRKAAKYWGGALGGAVGSVASHLNPLNAFDPTIDLIDREIANKKKGVNHDQIDAPNREAAKARAQQINIQGIFSFENSPSGMTFQAGKGSKIKTSGLGTQ